MYTWRTTVMLASVALIGAVLFVLLTVFMKQEVRYASLPATQSATIATYSTTAVDEPVPTEIPPTEEPTELISTYEEEGEKLVVPEPTPEVQQKKIPAIEKTVVVAPRPKEPKPTIPTPLRMQFSAKEMLDAHNAVRTEMKLPSLTWSQELTDAAGEWARVLKSEGCTYRHDPNLTVGENTFWSWLSIRDGMGLISTPKDAVTWWADEKRYYNYRTNTCDRGKDCGHYTQIVWATTTSVGCAVETCLYDGGQADVWVCRYSPAGNVVGVRPY